MENTDTNVTAGGPLARRHRVRWTGAGTDVVVLSHGLGTDQSSWHRIVPALAQRFRVVSFDLPGVGPLLPADFDSQRYRYLSAYADDLLDLLDELGIARCRYVGHSVSGMIGALASVTDPGRFERLVMLNASPRYLDDAHYRGGFRQQDLDAIFDAMRTQYTTWVAGFAPAAVGVRLPGPIQEFAAGFLAMRPDVTVAIARVIFESDLRAVLGQIRVPTVLVHTRGDIAVPVDVAHYMARQIADATLVWIDAQGHLPQLSAPGQLLQALEAHL